MFAMAGNESFTTKEDANVGNRLTRRVLPFHFGQKVGDSNRSLDEQILADIARIIWVCSWALKVSHGPLPVGEAAERLAWGSIQVWHMGKMHAHCPLHEAHASCISRYLILMVKTLVCVVPIVRGDMPAWPFGWSLVAEHKQGVYGNACEPRLHCLHDDAHSFVGHYGSTWRNLHNECPILTTSYQRASAPCMSTMTMCVSSARTASYCSPPYRCPWLAVRQRFFCSSAWKSVRLLTVRSLVRPQPGEFCIVVQALLADLTHARGIQTVINRVDYLRHTVDDLNSNARVMRKFLESEEIVYGPDAWVEVEFLRMRFNAWKIQERIRNNDPGKSSSVWCIFNSSLSSYRLFNDNNSVDT